MAEEAMAREFPEFTQLEIVGAEEAGNLFTDIWDWIQNAVDTIIGTITRWITDTWNNVKNAVVGWITSIYDWFRSWINPILEQVERFLDWVVLTWNRVVDFVNNAWQIITGAVTSGITIVKTWISDAVSDIWGWISTKVGEVWEWITESAANLASTIGAWFSETWATTTSLFSTWGSAIADWFSDMFGYIAQFWQNWWSDFTTTIGNLKDWLADWFATGMEGWWEFFVGRILDFGSWIGNLLDAVWEWLNRDVPGSSPFWEGIVTGFMETIGNFIVKWFWEFPKWFFADLPERTIYGLTTSFEFLGDMFGGFVDTFMEAVTGFTEKIGYITPGNVMGNYSSVAKIGLAAITGLVAMTVVGEFINPLSHLGLGHLSAMIYDVTNYKLITGAMMGALTFALLKTPLQYHFNKIFRPRLFTERDLISIMDRRIFEEPEALATPGLPEAVMSLQGDYSGDYVRDLIGYFGFPPDYYAVYKELATTRLGYFALAGVARGGYYDFDWFQEALLRSGYSNTSIRELHKM